MRFIAFLKKLAMRIRTFGISTLQLSNCELYGNKYKNLRYKTNRLVGRKIRIQNPGTILFRAIAVKE